MLSHMCERAVITLKGKLFPGQTINKVARVIMLKCGAGIDFYSHTYRNASCLCLYEFLVQ